MKIALVGRYGEGDILTGPERVARDLYLKLNSTQQQIIFIEYFFSNYNGSSIFKKIFGKEKLYDVQILRLGLIPLLVFLFRHRFDIVHIINLQRFTIPLFLIKAFIKTRTITTYHGLIKSEIPKGKYFANKYFLDFWMEKISLKKSDLLVFPSELLRELFRNNYRIEIKKSLIIPNGVGSIFLEQRNPYSLIYDKVNIVFYNGYGSFINRGLIELIFLLKKVESRIKLYVIGNKIETSSKENIEIEFVELMDQNKLVSFLKDKHFVIKGPAYDSFSIFVVECMMCGIIPIINEKIGIKDFISHGINGFVFDSGSPDDLSNLFSEIVDGKYDLQFVSANARKIYSELSWDKIAEQYIKAYGALLA